MTDLTQVAATLTAARVQQYPNMTPHEVVDIYLSLLGELGRRRHEVVSASQGGGGVAMATV